jgi:hypothetical protein
VRLQILGIEVIQAIQSWPVKTLSDAREKLVNYKPHDSSIGRFERNPIRTSDRTPSGSREWRRPTTGSRPDWSR